MSGRLSGLNGLNRSSENLAFEFTRDSVRDASSPPEWRVEIKKRVAEAKERKRKPDRGADQPNLVEPVPASTAPAPAPARIPDPKRSAVDPQPIAKSADDVPRSLRAFQAAAIQNLDPERRAGSLRLHPSQRELAVPLSARTPAPAAAPSVPLPEPVQESWVASKSILLTRTLSGLIDLLAIAGCTGLFLIVSIHLGNVEAFSLAFVPVVSAAAMFFYVYYSFCFLALCRQTAGMMLTGLKLVDEQGGTLGFGQLALSTGFFLISWGALCVGLFWGLWDRQARCMHDIVSRTRVVRC